MTVWSPPTRSDSSESTTSVLTTPFASAYGWSDLDDLGHDFHETRHGVRYTFSPAARQEILDRLLEFNHERRAAEDAAGLHDKKTRASKQAVTVSSPQTSIFGDD